MKSMTLALIIVFALAFSVAGQDVDEFDPFTYQYFVPEVEINTRSASLQSSLFPDMYISRSPVSDLRWARDHASDLIEFWAVDGDTVLHVMRELSGIEWYEEQFSVHLVRHFPSLGASNPLVMPVGGFGPGKVLEAAPEDNPQRLVLLYLLAHRMLDQSNYPPKAVYLAIADHPLMRPGIYRRDCLAWLLALATADKVMGYEDSREAYNSAFIKNHQPGRILFESEYLKYWLLSPDRPLAEWVGAEPMNSQLVVITRPPRVRNTNQTANPGADLEGVPLRGDLGFSVVRSGRNKLQVDKVDTYRLAYQCGLREGDVIQRVDGKRPRSHRQLIEYVLASLHSGGTALDISRQGQAQLVILQPVLDNAGYDDSYDVYGPTFPADSLDDGTGDR